MKNTLRNTLLKAALVAAIALPFSAQMVKAATLTANLTDVTNSGTQNYPTPKVTITDDGQPAGTLKIRVEVIPGPTGGTADLRGVFFNLPSGVTGATITRTAGGPITAIEGTSSAFGSIGQSANLNGSGATFGVGVEIGSQGIGGNPPDDFQFVEFTLSGTGLTLAKFSQVQFGVRMMSVSDSANGKRDLSSKTLGNTGTLPSPSPSPSGSPSPSPSGSPSPSPSGSPSPSPSGSPSPSPSGSPSPSPSGSPSPSPSGSPSPSPTTPTGGGGGGGTPPDVAEPITIIGMGLGLGGLLLSRQRRNKNK